MKRLNGIQFRQGVEQAVGKIASDLGMKVTLFWDSGISTAGIDKGGKMYLANVADDAVVNAALVDKYTGFVVHELLHRKYTDFSVRGDSQYLCQLHNAVEDAWIERTGIAAGLTGNITGLLTTLVNGMVDEADGIDWADPRQYPFVLAVYARGFAKPVPLADGLEPIFSEAKRRVAKCQSSTDTLAVAVWVFEQLKALDKPKEKPKGEKPKGKKGEKGEGQGDGEGQGKGKGQGKGQGQGDGQDGPSEGSDGPEGGDKGEGKGKGAGQEKTAGKARPVTGNEKAREVEPTLEGTGTGNGGCYSKEYGTRKEGYHTSEHNLSRDLSVSVPAKMRYEVKRLFENTATEDFQTNRRAGSLNVRSLHKVATSDRLFKRRLEAEGIDSAVIIMLDVSGSMFNPHEVYNEQGHAVHDAEGNPTYQHYIDDAVKTCAAMLDTLNKAGVKTMVVTFGSYASVLKPWEMPVPRALERIARIGSGQNTNDYGALRLCHEMLHSRPESRKVVFVITDGCGDEAAVREQCHAGVALGITTIGVGIALDVSDSYPVSVTVRNAANLGEVAFKQIKLAA
jgi:Mg-chelatase subunit ChlD